MAHILVIDDDFDLLNMLRLMLERGGHTVTTTADGADGLTKARELQPDLAIVDVMMPGMHGYQVCRALRDDPVTANIVVLILTARAQPVDREAALAARADDYMSKPVSPTELIRKVDELLEGRKKPIPVLSRILTIMSLRGGVGVSSIAVNVALREQGAGRRRLPRRFVARLGARCVAAPAQPQGLVGRVAARARRSEFAGGR